MPVGGPSFPPDIEQLIPPSGNEPRVEDEAERRLSNQLGLKGIFFGVLGPEDDTSLVQACHRLGCGSVIRNAADGMAAENAYRVEWEQELALAGIPSLTVNGEMIRRFGLGGARPARPFLSDDGSVESDSLPANHPLLLLQAFLLELPARNYLADMWISGRDRTSSSQLSTHFAAGTLSSDRAPWETTKAERRWKAANPSETRSTEAASFRNFRSRVGMRTGS